MGSNDNEPAARGREVNCNLHHKQSWVSRVTAVTRAAPLAPCARPTARRGRSRRVVRPPQPVSAPSVKKSKSVEKKQADRFKKQGKVEPAIEKQFEASRLYAVIASRPGQSGRCDGYILEGEELAFYQRAIRK